MNGDGFYTTVYAGFIDAAEAIIRSQPDNLTRWVIIYFNNFRRKGSQKVNKSVKAHVYLLHMHMKFKQDRV